MTSAWFLGARQGVPQDESVVRSTIQPVRTDDASAELDKPPDWNELDTDESGELTGLSPRMVGSDTVESVQYRPWWAGLATAPHNVIIDQQVATSGTAAHREESGEQGHGSMFFEQGIEPVIRDGAKFGNEYFVAGQTDIQQGAGKYMAPADTDHWLQAVAQRHAEDSSRQAFQSSNFAAFLNG